MEQKLNKKELSAIANIRVRYGLKQVLRIMIVAMGICIIATVLMEYIFTDKNASLSYKSEDGQTVNMSVDNNSQLTFKNQNDLIIWHLDKNELIYNGTSYKPIKETAFISNRTQQKVSAWIALISMIVIFIVLGYWGFKEYKFKKRFIAQYEKDNTFLDY